ncbi:MAG: arylsulfatase [Henriciella sp.]
MRNILLSVVAFLAGTTLAFAQPVADQTKPNIVVILIDDAALMDLGVYGGEAQTPNIDALAARGVMFTQYRTSPLCSPTRAMLLTGLDNHQTGVATIPEVLPPEHKGQAGYTMALEPGVLTLADRLRPAGYRTLMSGKWHLGETEDEMPNSHGFDRSFALAASGADNWDDKSYMPYYKDAPWWEDGVEAALPEDFYSSEFIVDKMIEYLDGTDQEQPFFAYLPFQAIHIPVQAPAEFITKYDGVYDQGWGALQKARFARAQDLGLISQNAEMADMPSHARAWDALSESDRELYSAMMEVNAAMLDAMDFHIGRFVDYLKAKGQYENSIFVITSDNGPEYNRGDEDLRLKIWQSMNGYNIDPERAGQPGSWGFIGPEWAAAAATPGALYKFYATEGGLRAPLIIAGPEIGPAKTDAPAMVSDLTPTLLDWVAAPSAPSGSKPMTGRSLLPLLRGEAESVYGPNDIRAIEVSGNSALYKGEYKITRSMPPMGDANWKLFDIVSDPGETTDLSAVEPERFADLQAEYAVYAAANGVLEMPEGYNSAQAVADNATARFYQHNRLALIILGLVLLGLLYGLWRLARFIFWRVRT